MGGSPHLGLPCSLPVLVGDFSAFRLFDGILVIECIARRDSGDLSEITLRTKELFVSIIRVVASL